MPAPYAATSAAILCGAVSNVAGQTNVGWTFLGIAAVIMIPFHPREWRLAWKAWR